MNENMLDFQSLIILSEQFTRVVCSPDLEIRDDEFYSALQRTIEVHRLPVECTNCLLRLQELPSPSKRLLIGMADGQIRHLRVLVGFDRLGSLAYIDRKLILIPPDLPPPISADSHELPPRLIPNSRELPAIDPKQDPTRTRYRNKAHQARCQKIRQRYQERRMKIVQRQEERRDLFADWLEEVNETMGRVRNNPQLGYFKDSVDAMIQIVVADLEARGARVRDQGERERREEELKERAEEIRHSFF